MLLNQRGGKLMSQKQASDSIPPALLNSLDLSEKEQAFLVSIWKRISHFKKRATWAASTGRLLTLIAVIGSLTVPVLLVTDVSGSYEWIFRVLAIIISLIASVIILGEKTFRFREKAIAYNRLALELENETSLYLTKTGPYAGSGTDKSFNLFVQRVLSTTADAESTYLSLDMIKIS
jgi:hypothetical protein